MKNLSQKLIEEKNQKNASYPWLVLLTITFNDDDSTVLRLVRNPEDIEYQGNIYTKFSFELEPSQHTSTGEIPTLTLKVNNISRVIQPFLESLDGAVNSIVVITVINYRFLKEDYTELEETFTVLASSADVKWVTFTLGGKNLLRQRCPLYRYLANHCRWDFDTTTRSSVECNYIIDGDSTGKTTCNRTLEQCRLRDNVSNFGGFIGLTSGGIKIV